jgi:hypothetical protein
MFAPPAAQGPLTRFARQAHRASAHNTYDEEQYRTAIEDSALKTRGYPASPSWTPPSGAPRYMY